MRHSELFAPLDIDDPVRAFSTNAPAMENTPQFYAWVLRELDRLALPRDLSILDIGCGTGTILERLANRGFRQQTGVDFAPGCLDLAVKRVPSARLLQHDITGGSLSDRYDLALMVNVIDFVTQPAAALANVKRSLNPDGRLLITIRNRLAYFPWYHFRGLARLLGRSPRILHWFLWFTTPLGLRGRGWPHERVYTPGEIRQLLRGAGFTIEQERGTCVLPMLRIPGIAVLESAASALDSITDRLPPTPACFWYLFVCRPLKM